MIYKRIVDCYKALKKIERRFMDILIGRVSFYFLKISPSFLHIFLTQCPLLSFTLRALLVATMWLSG